MTSISGSDEIILDVRNFSIAYQVQYYAPHSLRDLFVNMISTPVDFFFKKKQRVLLLDNINLKVKKGERVGILGSNGSGKTSLCRFISGIYGTQRNIKINGRVKGIFDTEVAVLPELSGRENLKILAHFFFPELTNEERRHIILETAEFSELGKHLDVPFKYYSKGMRSRLFLSLISSRPTDLLILDEVFNGADHFFNEKMTERIKKTILESGSVIFISHSNDLIREVCSRVVVFDNKRIVFDGTPDEGIEFYKAHCAHGIQGA